MWLFSGNFIQFREDIWLFFKKYIKNIKKIAIYVEKILYVMINQVYVEEQLKKRALRTQEKEIKLTEIETN